MLIAAFGLLMFPFFVVIAIVIVIVAIAYYTTKEKKQYQKEVALQKTKPQPSVIMDSERIKIQFRMDMMNRFIRNAFQNVRDWKVVGDDDSMHPQFFTSAIKTTPYFFVRVMFLDGTEKTVKVDISLFKQIEESTLKLCVTPKPDNEQEPRQKFVKVEEPEQPSKPEEKPGEKPEQKPEQKQTPTPAETPKKVETPAPAKAKKDPVKDMANEFLKRKDVFDILDREIDTVLEDVPEEEEIFKRVKDHLMEEHGIILYKAEKGWGFTFS